MYAAIAFCVGTILLLLATNVCSFENSLITAFVPPSINAPNLNSSSPARSNCEALIVTIPVDCSTLNSSPTLKLPSWSVLA